MARLTRVHQKVFASNASNNGVFGSLQAGNPQISNDVATLQSLSAFENGWDDAIEQGDKLPPLEEFQGIQYGISYQQAYMLQEGIPEWNTNTPYYKGSLTKVINGTSFKIFSSLTDNNTGNVTTNTSHWKLVYDSDIGYADTNFSNLLAPAKNISNWSDNVSNCITEIPQDIKLELNNGTLTLKSGSIITFPDGTQYQTTADRTATSGSASGIYVFCAATTYLDWYSIERVFSGTTAPSGISGNNAILWYDTTNGVLKRSTDGGATWAERAVSLPIAIVSANNGFSSIDQVFNGFGYIGSSIFALPGVKGLVPNGRNTDGTLKNTAFTTSSLLIYSRQSTYTDYAIILKGNSVSNTICSYDENANYNLNSSGGHVSYAIIGKMSSSNNNGTISKFSVKPVFHAVDYYDLYQTNKNIETLDSQNVKLTGNQNISGNKTFSGSTSFSGTATFGNSVEFQVKPITDTLSNDDRYISKWSNYTQGTAPSNNIYGGVSCFDSNNVEMASCYGGVDTSNTSRAALWVKSPVSGSSQTAQILIQCDSSGNFSTYAPTRSSATDNSNNIATTAWVNNWASTNSTSALASWSNGANGYYKFKNGLIIQWGRWSDSANPSIVFPTAFSNTNYSITATDERDTTNAYGTTFWSKTTTGVTIHAQAGSGNWIAIGY